MQNGFNSKEIKLFVVRCFARVDGIYIYIYIYWLVNILSSITILVSCLLVYELVLSIAQNLLQDDVYYYSIFVMNVRMDVHDDS